MTYSVAFGDKIKRFGTLRAAVRWVIDVQERNKGFRFRFLGNGEPLDDVDTQVVELYFNRLKGQ